MIPPAVRPRTIDEAKKKAANGQPNSPAETTSSLGEVSGEATMNATIGAHGAVVAIDSTTAVVPHEQNGSRPPPRPTRRPRSPYAAEQALQPFDAKVDLERGGAQHAQGPGTASCG